MEDRGGGQRQQEVAHILDLPVDPLGRFVPRALVTLAIDNPVFAFRRAVGDFEHFLDAVAFTQLSFPQASQEGLPVRGKGPRPTPSFHNFDLLSPDFADYRHENERGYHVCKPSSQSRPAAN